MESPAEYLDSPMDGDDMAYPCKGCGDILEEGKAFELAGNRWHLNCFRCNTCGTLLDSDANLLLLGDGSLICNNCTYSCNACGNKIEDLAILTGDQAFCATCFRCRNCKRKIENLRYARTSQGIFCMSCHESLMARRRKKSRAAANAKLKKDDQSPMLVDKSLPALPPSAVMQSALLHERSPSLDTETPTELSPRPCHTNHNGSSSRSSSSMRPRESSEQEVNFGEGHVKDGLTLPTTTYRNNRHSQISQVSDLNSADAESFFIPLALDPSPAMTPRSTSETWTDTSRKGKENKAPDRDYFGSKPQPRAETKSHEVSSASSPHVAFQDIGRQSSEAETKSHEVSLASSPHVAFQDIGRQPSEAETAQIKESIRKAQTGGRASSKPAPTENDTQVQHAQSPTNGNTSHESIEKFRLGDVPKGKRVGGSRDDSMDKYNSDASRSDSGGYSTSYISSRKESSGPITRTESPKPLLAADKAAVPRSSLDSGMGDDDRPSIESSRSQQAAPQARGDSGSTGKSIARKEIGTGTGKNVATSATSSSPDTASSTASSTDTTCVTPTVNGKTISAPLHQMPLGEDLAPPTRAPTRPNGAQTQKQTNDSYMAPRAVPPRPPINPIVTQQSASQIVHELPGSGPSANGKPVSPKLPRWSAGGDFTMDEDMARILGGTDESSQSLLRRVSNAVRHGRTSSDASLAARQSGHGRSVSETTRSAQSPRWPRTPIAELDNSGAREISSPISIHSPISVDDPALLRRQLRNSEQRVAELERQFTTEKEMRCLNKKLVERRKTISVLDSQTEIMIRQLEALAGYVERAKDTKTPINVADLEDSVIKDFVQKVEKLKQAVSAEIESLYETRNEISEDKDRIMADRDRALLEFESLSSKNAQLADMNNDLTHQIQERFKAQSAQNADSPRPMLNGLEIYTHHSKDKSSSSVHVDESSMRPSTSTTMFGSGSGNYPQSMDQDSRMDPATVLEAPHMINIRKGQPKKFNWKKGGQTVAKGVSKGFKGAFASVQQPQNQQWQGQTGDSIGMPYNMTVAPVEGPASLQGGSLPRSATADPRGATGFGLFKKSNNMPKSMSSGSFPTAENPSTLFGSDLVERADYERRQIPSIVTRCIEEVELRGMDIEGIYRKTGGSGQVKAIQEGFEKTEDYDISDPSLDITAVTSALKQYFRKLPMPLLTFDVYDRVLESTSIDDDEERCNHLRKTFNSLPPKHRDCLEFLIFHLARVAVRESENLMTPKNLAVVFAPTIMRDTSLEREMSDMHAKNNAVQFVIENSHEIFADS
ncbi:hypothetical protein BJ878DRAFT_1691 [Calycina marina]|uniref:Uncharacterized protein n=1 Tax=Calycina marina TaxID=1763456 RepID=A0A9P7ZBZ7_9HELO|nr:hypothetical protein BJ878DRAFT_1691 [Calycina marina]